MSNYREVELPPLAHSPLWDTYLAQRERIRELELALDAAQDTIGDIRTKWMALRAKYDGWIANEEYIALRDTIGDVT